MGLGDLRLCLRVLELLTNPFPSYKQDDEGSRTKVFMVMLCEEVGVDKTS